MAFPHNFAAAFGELGSDQCNRWVRALVDAGARVRGCVMWQLNLAKGVA